MTTYDLAFAEKTSKAKVIIGRDANTLHVLAK